MTIQVDRDTLLRLAWKHGRPYPPRYSSKTLIEFLQRRALSVALRERA